MANGRSRWRLDVQRSPARPPAQEAPAMKSLFLVAALVSAAHLASASTPHDTAPHPALELLAPAADGFKAVHADPVFVLAPALELAEFRAPADVTVEVLAAAEVAVRDVRVDGRTVAELAQLEPLTPLGHPSNRVDGRLLRFAPAVLGRSPVNRSPSSTVAKRNRGPIAYAARAPRIDLRSSSTGDRALRV
jgi:hypothetical protein